MFRDMKSTQPMQSVNNRTHRHIPNNCLISLAHYIFRVIHLVGQYTQGLFSAIPYYHSLLLCRSNIESIFLLNILKHLNYY